MDLGATMNDEDLKGLVSCLNCKKCNEIKYGKSAKCGNYAMNSWVHVTTLWYPKDFGCFESK